jgi:hypothetical protein
MWKWLHKKQSHTYSGMDLAVVIFLHTKRSFVERRYSPSTGMDQNEWEFILEELIIMCYIVKEEVVR